MSKYPKNLITLPDITVEAKYDDPTEFERAWRVRPTLYMRQINPTTKKPYLLEELLMSYPDEIWLSSFVPQDMIPGEVTAEITIIPENFQQK